MELCNVYLIKQKEELKRKSKREKEQREEIKKQLLYFLKRSDLNVLLPKEAHSFFGL